MPPHQYDTLVQHLRSAISELASLGLGENLAKGRVGEIFLAHHLGHTLVPGDKGADGVCTDGKRFEYKVSVDDQYNFNFGSAATDAREARVDTHFAHYTGAYCGLLRDGKLVKVVYCPVNSLVPHLKSHLETVTGNTWQKNFTPIAKFAAVPGATWMLWQADEP